LRSSGEPLDKSIGTIHRIAMNRRIIGGAIVGTALLVGIVAILGFAHANAILDEGKRCFPGFLHAQWPKWIGCAMAAHENLAGGLIGGAGALFAAFIAADAVWQQIIDAREQARIAEDRRKNLEYYSFERVVEWYSRLLRPFENVVGAEDIKYVNGLNTLYKTGNLVPFFGTLPAEYQSLARDAWERLSNLNFALGEAQKIGQGGTLDLKARAEINAGIRDVVESMIEFRQIAKDEVSKRVG
jgi:hypothetical protein